VCCGADAGLGCVAGKAVCRGVDEGLGCVVGEAVCCGADAGFGWTTAVFLGGGFVFVLSLSPAYARAVRRKKRTVRLTNSLFFMSYPLSMVDISQISRRTDM
jgi:hypothetical protein